MNDKASEVNLATVIILKRGKICNPDDIVPTRPWNSMHLNSPRTTFKWRPNSPIFYPLPEDEREDEFTVFYATKTLGDVDSALNLMTHGVSSGGKISSLLS